VNHNLSRLTISMRALVTKIHADYVAKTNTYRDSIKITGYLFDEYMQLFEKIEEQGYSQKSTSLDEDSFLCEQRYISNTKKITQAVYDLRVMLLKIWSDACDLEQ
jgi:hypothetical protein